MTENTILNMDKEREIKWTFGGLKVFSKRAREILKRNGARDVNGRLIAEVPADVQALLSFLAIEEITEAAIGATTGLSSLDGPKGEPSEASRAIEAYIARGGSLDDIHYAIWIAYYTVRDPLSLPKYRQTVEEVRRKKMATASGEKPSESPTSS